MLVSRAQKKTVDEADVTKLVALVPELYQVTKYGQISRSRCAGKTPRDKVFHDQKSKVS